MLEAVNTVLKKFGKSSFIGFCQGPIKWSQDQGRGPSSCTNNSHKSTFWLWPITSNRAKRFPSALKLTDFPSLDNNDDFLTLLKLSNFNLESCFKETLEGWQQSVLHKSCKSFCSLLFCSEQILPTAFVCNTCTSTAKADKLFRFFKWVPLF